MAELNKIENDTISSQFKDNPFFAEDKTYKKVSRQIKDSDQIEYVKLLKDPPIITVLDDKNFVPIRLESIDGTQTTKFISFDGYFKLVSEKIWDDPGQSQDAELITMDERIKDAAPYNVFYNSLKHCPETREQLYSIRFTDLLCPSLGKLKSSFHITFMADILWILKNFASRNLHKLPMTVIHGYEGFAWPEDETMKMLYPNIDYCRIEKKDGSLGCHHTKLSIFVYDDDSLRLVIGSANLYDNDWDLYNQQLWISPRCPKLPEGSSVIDGESPTRFKFALLDYLFAYDNHNIPSLKTWIDCVKMADFREIKVALLYTVPGLHYPRRNGSFVHILGHLLSQECTIPAPKEEHDSWRIVAQTSALGLMGSTPEDWLTTNFLKSLGSHKASPYLPTFPSVAKVKFSLIFPSMENCLNGYLGLRSAACCPYEKDVKQVQPWLLQHKCQWKADQTKRTRAISHSKCYCRISPCWQKMVYYFLTSSNLSRSGWGSKPNRDCAIFIRSWEMGVLFLPKYFGEEYFETMDVPNRKNQRLFPMMFDLPLTPYGPEDDSYCGEELLEKLNLLSVSDLNRNSEGTSGSEADHDGETDDEKEKSVAEMNRLIKKSKKKLKKDLADAESRNREQPIKRSVKTDLSSKKEYECKPLPALVEKRNMNYSGKPANDLFFPSFKKN